MEDSSLKRPKKLIVCCDGTWMNNANAVANKGTWLSPKWELQTPSNVTRIGRAILSEDSQHNAQIVYYQEGVGTGPGLLQRLIGGGTGAGLSENIREAYSFLANNYTPGDSIYLLGFSRGAFTARSIAALIGTMGLLEKKGLPVLFRVFEDWENAGNENYKISIKENIPDFEVKASPRQVQEYYGEYRAQLKQRGLTREVEITAVGVWETVGALGIPTTAFLQSLGLPAFLNPLQPYRFFDTSLGNHIKHAFQALALDERRSSYVPAIWERPEGCTTSLKQVWFPGVHKSVGGGYDDAGLADITLAWMMDCLQGVGIDFDEGYVGRQWRSQEHPFLPSSRLDSARDGHQHESLSHREQHDLSDIDEPHWALTRLYNSARFPTNLGGLRNRTPGRYCRTDYRTGKSTGVPMRDTNEFVHASVRVRLQDGGKGYGDRGRYQAAALTGNKWHLEAPDEQFEYGEDGELDRANVNVTIKPSAGEDGEGWTWVHGGDGKVLREDRLGRFEIMLLAQDREMLRRVLDGGARVSEGVPSSDLV